MSQEILVFQLLADKSNRLGSFLSIPSFLLFFGLWLQHFDMVELVKILLFHINYHLLELDYCTQN